MKKITSNGLILLLIACVVTFSFFYNDAPKYVLVDKTPRLVENRKDRSPKSALEGSNLKPFEGCTLPKHDPFDSSLSKHIDINWNRKVKARCNKNFKVISSLSKGTVKIEDKDMFCRARCFHEGEQNHKANKFEEWKEVKNSTFDCEFVEVQCRKSEDASKKANYSMLHADLKKVQSTASPPKANQKPYDVYVFLLDSVSTYSAFRYLPRTLNYVENSMNGIQFKYLNRVGLNSRPNALALFYGKAIEPVDRTAIGMKNVPEDEEWWENCNRFLDNDTSIFDEFRRDGYKTLLTDDWKTGIFHHPPMCKGLKQKPVDHSLDSFVIETYPKQYFETFHGRGCQFMHQRSIAYTKQFMEAYSDYPKFAWHWMAAQTHEDQAGAQVLDEDLVAMLSENKTTFDNSFVIFMSDHGCRACSITSTKIGQMEFSNPFFTMSVPMALRNPDLLKVMKENAAKLVTQYDVRATMLDILKYQPISNFADREPYQIPGEKGNSFLRRMEGERDCRTLPIPFHYCMCEFPMAEIESNSTMASKMGEAIINSANDQLKTSGMDSKCNYWSFGKVESIEGFAPFQKTQSVRITIRASKPYNKAIFMAVVHVKEDGKFNVGYIERIDRYWSRGWCAYGPLEGLCDCKNQRG